MDRLDRPIQNKRLASILQFYLDRCIRHGLVPAAGPERDQLQSGILSVEAGDFTMSFSE